MNAFKMHNSRQKLSTWCTSAWFGRNIPIIFCCAILLEGNLATLNTSSTMLQSINCTLFEGPKQLSINCSGSTADGVTQLEAVERKLADNASEQIEWLLIVNSKISHWPSRICSLTSLRDIRLDDNLITELPNWCIRRLSELKHLSVERNRLRFLQDGLFDGLKNLKTLSFKENQIETIGLRVFSNRSDLPSLEIIVLDDNKLTVLEPWPLIRAQVVNGSVVSLARNSISRFTNTLGWSFVCGMKSFSIELDLALNNITHLTDFINGFGLTTTRNLLCLFGEKGHSPFNVKFARNPIVCDCIDFKIVGILKHFPYIALLDDIHCAEPINLANQKFVTVVSKPEQLVCDIEELCPPKGRCVLVPANRTLIVDASNIGLRELPLQLPPLKTERYKYQLDFSRNSILRVASRAYLQNDTSFLDLSQSDVETVTNEAWMDLASLNGAIRLHGNRLTTLSPMIQNVNFSFRSLTLYGNPLSCSCQDSWMKHWLKRYQDRLEVPDSLLCLSPSWLTGRVIFSVEDSEHCVNPNTSKMVAIGTSTAIGGLIVLTLLVFVAVHRLRVHLFSAFRVHPFDRDDCEGEDMDQDVFLTCSYEDRSHALKVLRLLEDKNFKVCYHERDFMGGQTIADNICQAVFRSRRVLCLVSENFVESSYCVYEFETALDHNVKLKRKRVIVLLLEKIDVRGATVPRELQQYLSSHTVIEYWSSNWLNNLLYALPTKPIPQTSSDGDTVLSSTPSIYT